MLNTVGTSFSIKGNLISDADFYFDGHIEGNIEARRSLVTLGPNSKVDGRIRAREIIVGGSVLGDIFALERVEVQSTGRVNGNISTIRIALREGAYIKGRVSDAQPFTKGAAAEHEALHARYSKLVDFKYERGLTAAEEKEMKTLFTRLSGNQAGSYEPLFQNLHDNEAETARVS